MSSRRTRTRTARRMRREPTRIRYSPALRRAATELVESAEAYKQGRIAEAEGENAKFLSLLTEYQKAPEITRKRLYLETMEEVLSKSETIIVEPGSVVPYLPLDRKGRTPQ